jgi:hypothetical protein
MFERVDRVYRAFLRHSDASQIDIMVRLERWIKNILYICGTAFDDKNTHLGMDKMDVFTHPHNEGFSFLLDQVWDHLPYEVQNDYRNFMNSQQEQTREKLESSINRIRRILSPRVREGFAQRAESINALEMIREGGHVIIDLGKAPGWSYEQKMVLGGLLIDEFLSAKDTDENLPAD